MEMKICPKYTPKPTYKNAGENSRLQHMECSLEKSATHTGTCFLGSLQWSECPILDGFLVANATPSTGIKSTILRKSHSRPCHSQSSRFVDRYPNQLSLAKMETYSSGTASGYGLWPATLATSYNPKANLKKHIPKHSHMGIYTSWKLYSQGGIHFTGEIPQSTER